MSSPGVNRPLFILEDYTCFVGESVKLKLKIPIANQKNFTGKIIGIEDNYIVLKIDGMNKKIDFNNIKKANIIKYT